MMHRISVLLFTGYLQATYCKGFLTVKQTAMPYKVSKELTKLNLFLGITPLFAFSTPSSAGQPCSLPTQDLGSASPLFTRL